MTKVKYPGALHDFYKSNGSDTVVFNREPSLTRQEFAEECDINALMKRYEGHGQSINNLMRQPAQGGVYLDFAEIPDTLMGYMEFMKSAEAAFMTLPAIVRKEFENNPYAFVEFASDPANLEQMRAWELAAPAPVEKAAGAVVQPQPQQAAQAQETPPAPPVPPTHAST